MEDSTILAINGIAAITSGTIVAVEPVLLPTSALVNGISNIKSIRNGMLLTILRHDSYRASAHPLRSIFIIIGNPKEFPIIIKKARHHNFRT